MTQSTVRNLKRAAAIGASVATILVAVLGAVWAASADRAADRQQLQQQAERIEDHEARLRAVEQIAGDVKWMRGWMERRNGK